MRVLLVCAVEKELAWLSPPPAHDVLVCGVGPVESSARVARALAVQRYDVVVNAGIAGALPGVADVGEGVIVHGERFELDLETGSPISLPDGAQLIDRVNSDAELVRRLVRQGFRSVAGLTVGRVTATDSTAERIRTLGAQVESMEGFSVLRAAEIAGVRSIEVRGISNVVGARALSQWDFAAGIGGLKTILRTLLSILE